MTRLWFRDRRPLEASPAWQQILSACESKHVALRWLVGSLLVAYAIVIACWTPDVLPQLLRSILAFGSATADLPAAWEDVGASLGFLAVFLITQRAFVSGLGRPDALRVPVSAIAVVPRLFILVPSLLLLVLGLVWTLAEMLGADVSRFDNGWTWAGGALCLAVLGWGGYRASRRVNIYELLARYLFLLAVLCIVVLVFALPVDLILASKEEAQPRGNTAAHKSLLLSSHLLVWLLLPTATVLRVRAEQRLAGKSVYLDGGKETEHHG